MKAKNKAKYPVAGVTQLREILEEQKYRCALTGERLTPENSCFDHIVPLSKGGSSLKENLQAVTKVANLSKGSLTMSEYNNLCFVVLNRHRKKYGRRVPSIQ